MPDLYPAIEPYDHGMLDVGDGNLIYWESCGHPAGKPALVLHRGPGPGCTPWLRRLFDPAAYRVVLFDQRGCGPSRPHAAAATTGLRVNPTLHRFQGIEALRPRLDVERGLR